MFFREMSLEPGEKYAIVVDLGLFASFAEPGQFVLQASSSPSCSAARSPRWSGPTG